MYDPFDGKADNFRYAAYILKSSGEPQWVDLGEAKPIHRGAFFRLSPTIKSNTDTFYRQTDDIKQVARQLDEVFRWKHRKFYTLQRMAFS